MTVRCCPPSRTNYDVTGSVPRLLTCQSCLLWACTLLCMSSPCLSSLRGHSTARTAQRWQFVSYQRDIASHPALKSRKAGLACTLENTSAPAGMTWKRPSLQWKGWQAMALWHWPKSLLHAC
eukprot:1942102-Amphidinium_carterae.1